MKLVINGYFLSKSKTGIGQYLLQILLNQNWNLDILILIPEYLKDETQNLPKYIKNKVKYIPIWYKRNDLLAQVIWEKYVFPREVKKLKADVAWSPQPTISYIPHIKHIMTVHDVIYWRLPEYIPNWKMKLYVRGLESSIKKASQIVTVSKFSANEIEDIFGIDSKTIPVIPPASPRVNTLEINPIVEGKYIFYEGGLDVRKNVPKLIEAFAIIVKKHPDIKLYIAGNYFKSPIIPYIPALIKQYKLEDNVVMIGYISDQDLLRYIKYAEVLVYPSLYEGFGIPILEGFSLGTPVVTSNLGAMKELGSDAVVTVNPKSAKSIAKGIENVLNDDLLRQSIIHKGTERLNDFNWQTSAKNLGQMFEN